jgi:hypothetical protein
MAAAHSNPLLILQGQELNGVTFIRDYIQFQFDGPVLNAYTLPTVVIPDRHLH